MAKNQLPPIKVKPYDDESKHNRNDTDGSQANLLGDGKGSGEGFQIWMSCLVVCVVEYLLVPIVQNLKQKENSKENSKIEEPTTPKNLETIKKKKLKFESNLLKLALSHVKKIQDDEQKQDQLIDIDEK